MFYTLIKHGFLTNQSAQVPIYIVNRYKYYTNGETHAGSYTAIADIMLDAGWS